MEQQNLKPCYFSKIFRHVMEQKNLKHRENMKQKWLKDEMYKIVNSTWKVCLVIEK